MAQPIEKYSVKELMRYRQIAVNAIAGAKAKINCPGGWIARKDLTESQIIERQNNFAEKMGKRVYAYDNKYKLITCKSISECSRRLKMNRSDIWMCCQSKGFNKNYLLSFKEETNDAIKNYFDNYLKHLQENLNIKFNNLSKTNALKDNLIVSMLKYEILSFDIAEQLNNAVKSIFVYHKLTKNLTTIDNVDDYNKYLYAPTYTILQRWLREKHKVLVEVNYRRFAIRDGDGYFYTCGSKKYHSVNSYFGKNTFQPFDTYEDAMETGLQQGLKIVIDKINEKREEKIGNLKA